MAWIAESLGSMIWTLEMLGFSWSRYLRAGLPLPSASLARFRIGLVASVWLHNLRARHEGRTGSVASLEVMTVLIHCMSGADGREVKV